MARFNTRKIIEGPVLNVLLYLWQLPQNIVALLMWPFIGTKAVVAGDYDNGYVRICSGMRGGISLGRYIFLSPRVGYNNQTILHEQGHQQQSIMLGWFYLPVIGLPSLIWATLHSYSKRYHGKDYYSFFTEKWADNLGGVIR